MTSLIFRRIDLDEIRDIYYNDMVRQFPDSERRSYANIVDLTTKGLYSGYGLFRETEICAYALLASIPQSGYIILDYLAVPDPWKKQGYGSEMLYRLRSHYSNTDRILIETEDPDALSGAERDIAMKRLGFYSKNGYRETNVEIGLFSVIYRLYVSNNANDTDNQLIDKIELLYRTMIPLRLYERNVSLRLRTKEEKR